MSQKTDNLIKLALVFFVSLLSFSIGTYVGKKYSDNQHKLSLLEPKKDTEHVGAKTEEFASDVIVEADKSHHLADAPVDATDGKPAALTDSEVAKIAEEFATEENNTEEKVVGNIEETEKTVGTLPAATATAATTATKKTSMTTQEQIPEERVPASVPAKKEISDLRFTVQVGSFPTQAEAEKMTTDLQSKGYKTTFIPADINGRVWYRVNVGLFGSIKEAQDYKKDFLEKTKISSAIVQRIQQ